MCSQSPGRLRPCGGRKGNVPAVLSRQNPRYQQNAWGVVTFPASGWGRWRFRPGKHRTFPPPQGKRPCRQYCSLEAAGRAGNHLPPNALPFNLPKDCPRRSSAPGAVRTHGIRYGQDRQGENPVGLVACGKKRARKILFLTRITVRQSPTGERTAHRRPCRCKDGCLQERRPPGCCSTQ